MDFSITVPSESIKLLLGLVKKVAKTNDIKFRVFVYFTVNGLYAIVHGIHVGVPLHLPMDMDGFVLKYSDIEILKKSEGDVTFSIFDTVDLDGGGDINSHGLQKGKVSVRITYIEKGIPKEIIENACVDVAIDLKYYQIPENAIESSRFLQTIAMCEPYYDRRKGCGDSVPVCGAFCLEGDKIIATNGHRMIVAKDVDIDSLVFFDSQKKPTNQFLLQGIVSSLLPKSGTCRLASRVETTWEHNYVTDEQVEKNTSLLYIVCPEYFIITTMVAGRYVKWQSLVVDDVEGVHKLHLDPRDVEVCLKRLHVLPVDKSRFKERDIVRFCFNEGRLCIESCAEQISNTRLRLSEFTTGSIAPETYLDVTYLEDALKIFTEVSQNPTEVDTSFGAATTYVQPLRFESNDALVIVMPCTGVKQNKITSVIDVKDHWERSAKKPVVQKQSKRSALFTNADKDIIAALRLENEQLKKEIETLRNNIINP
jgi:hypothetical protein